jgi:hypothetical protein
MSTGIRKVSYSSVKNDSYKIEFENGSTVSSVPLSSDNRYYELILKYLHEEGGVVEEYEFALSEKKANIISVVKNKKEEVKFMNFTTKEGKGLNIILTEKLIQLLKDKALHAKICKEKGINFSFSLLNEEYGETIFSIESKYSDPASVTLDSADFLFGFLVRIEMSLFSLNYKTCYDIIKEVNSKETLSDLNDYVYSLDLDQLFVNGISLSYADIN